MPVPFDIVEINGKGNDRISSSDHEKSNFTVVPGLISDGEKLKPMLVFNTYTIMCDACVP